MKRLPGNRVCDCTPPGCKFSKGNAATKAGMIGVGVPVGGVIGGKLLTQVNTVQAGVRSEGSKLWEQFALNMPYSNHGCSMEEYRAEMEKMKKEIVESKEQQKMKNQMEDGKTEEEKTEERKEWENYESPEPAISKPPASV